MSDLTRKEVIHILAIAGEMARLTGVNLSGLDLSGLNLSGVDLSYANLMDCNLNDAFCYRTIFAFGNLTNVQLSRVHLNDANLTGANLTNANLTKAVLRGTVLDGAMATHINLQGAKLQQISQVGVADWDTAVTDEHTKGYIEAVD